MPWQVSARHDRTVLDVQLRFESGFCTAVESRIDLFAQVDSRRVDNLNLFASHIVLVFCATEAEVHFVGVSVDIDSEFEEGKSNSELVKGSKALKNMLLNLVED